LSVRYSKYIPTISITGDFLLLNLFFVFGFCYLHPKINCFAGDYLSFYAYLNLLWLILTFSFGANKSSRNTRKKELLFTYIKIVVFYFFLFLLYFQIFQLNYYPRQDLKYLFPSFFVALIFWKFLLYYVFYFYRKLGYNFRNVLVVGSTQKTRELQRYFVSNKWNGYKFIGFIDDRVNKRRRVIGNWDQLKTVIEKNDVDEIYLAWDKVPDDKKQKVNTVIREFPLKLRIIPDYGDFEFLNADLVNYDLVPVLQFHSGPLGYWYNRFIKRAFDVLFSLVMMVGFLSWMSVILFVLSLFGSREGVFFRQKRTGADGKVFMCFKFRTMRVNADADEQQATRNDRRVTPVGKFLRKSSLDELPQFINVFIGNMSVVGPRPHMLKHTRQYRQLVKRFMLRHTVKPGITGLAQVRGYRGEIRRVSEIKNRVSFDVKYVETWSFSLDLKIIWLTVYHLIKGQKRAY
jgi:Undecaprenyl-phosphate glucose phosphotransferase